VPNKRASVKNEKQYENESVVEENDRYAVVQKQGKAAEIVARLDPRTS
jgi:hypothetical protein